MTEQKTEEWPEWLAPDTAARYLDTSIFTLSDWRLKGKGPAYSKAGQRLVRYRRADLDAWISGVQA